MHRCRGTDLRPVSDAFTVYLQRSGRTVRVPADKTVLQALLDVGVDVDFMCRNGLCGTCETRVLAGCVDHRDTYLTDAQRDRNQHMIICVSRADSESRLVLDL